MPIFENPGTKYRDREDAGKALASRLLDYRGEDPIVLAIPNGGVPVAAVIAEELGAELYLMIVRKLQIPDNPEAGFGALTSDESLLLNERLIKRIGLTQAEIQRQREKAIRSVRSRQKHFGKRAILPSLTGRTVVMVDDGLASGFTMEAAVEAARERGTKRIVVATPTSSMSAYRRLERKVDKIICPDLSRLPVFAVANAYQNWHDVDEAEVLAVLEKLQEPRFRKP